MHGEMACTCVLMYFAVLNTCTDVLGLYEAPVSTVKPVQ